MGHNFLRGGKRLGGRKQKGQKKKLGKKKNKRSMNFDNKKKKH